MRNFDNWDTQDLEITFGLKKDPKSTLLATWVQATNVFDGYTKTRLEKLKLLIFDYADYWNEDELKMQSISIILDIADFHDSRYSIFSQRTLSATVDGIEIGGRVDFMLAKGQQKPIQPYFFIHEYKQERKRENDPKGQLLAELLAAQERNENKFPLYGCYVIGRNWFFMVLEGKNYAVTDAFVASQDDIYQIISMLIFIKTMISKLL